MQLERKFTQLANGLEVSSGHEISGYASHFEAKDQGGDRVARGAYAASLARLETSGGRVKMLWQHDPTRPIGIWDEVREDGRGLWVRGRILTKLEQGREAAALIAEGAIDGLSIGYRTVRAEKAQDGSRRLLEVDLWEVSLVTFPMLREARIDRKEAPRIKPPETWAEGLRIAAGVMAETRRELSFEQRSRTR